MKYGGDRKMMRGLLGAVCVMICCWSPTGHAGHWGGSVDSYTLGHTAAFSGGAGLAIMGDAGSAWYNPAGLAKMSRRTVDISASVFMLRLRNVPDVLTLNDGVGKSNADLGSTEFLSVPSSLVYVWKVHRKLSLAFFVFQPVADTLTMSTNMAVSGTGMGRRALYDVRFDDHLTLSHTVAAYHVGPSLGWQVAPAFRLGISLGFVYFTGSDHIAYGSASKYTGPLGESVAAGHFGLEYTDDRTLIGFQGAVGFQWEITPSLHLGFVFRTPLVQFAAWYNSAYVESSLVANTSGDVTSDFQLGNSGESKQQAAVIGPMRMHLGLSYKLGKGWIALDVDVAPPFRNDEMGLRTRLAWNVKLGAKFKITNKITLGGGLFTDHSQNPELGETLLSAQVNYYGVTMGLGLRTEHALKPGSKAPSLVMETTFGLRYALGIGGVVGQAYDPFADDLYYSYVQNVFFHEVSFHLGSSMHF